MNSAVPARPVSQFVQWTFLLAGLAFLTGAFLFARHTRQFLEHSASAHGSVFDLKTVHSGRRRTITYAPVFRYTTKGGQLITVIAKVSSNPPDFHPGDEVQIRYDPQDPQHAVIDTFGQLWLGQTISALIGLVFIGIGLALAASQRRARLNLALQPDPGSGIVRL